MFTQQCSLICSMAQIETEESFSNLNLQRRGGSRRFQRSKSGDRSKSKQLNNNRKESPSFYLKNVYIRPSNLSQGLNIGVQRQNKEQECVPIKAIKRRNNHIRQTRQITEFKIESPDILQKRCQELNILLDKSHSYIIELQSKIETLQNQLNKAKNPIQDLSVNSIKLQPKEKGMQSKGSNLMKLRKQIAQTRKTDVVPTEVINEQIKILQGENLFLKEEVNKLKFTIAKYQEISIRIQSEKESQLQKLIQKLRRTIKQSQKRQDQLRLEIGMLRLRQSKLSQNKVQIQNQQLIYLRYRYQSLRKKYQQLKQMGLGRTNYLIEGNQQMQIDLQLSP